MYAGWNLYGLGRGMLAVALLVLLPGTAWAQTGRITGSVSAADGNPVAGAQVLVVGMRLGSLTDPEGRFTIAGVPAGTHDVQAVHIGYRPATAAGVQVAAGQDARVELRMESSPVELGGVVISASRQAERVTDAPATITRIGAGAIQNSIGNSFAHALREVPGLDFVQVGVNAVAINARGFNSSFNNRMLMMEDGRVAVLAENGLPVGGFTTTPKIDLAGMEVLVGPGAALYGADASSGVLYLQTKDPRRYPGTSVEVTGGARQYKDVQFRHAGVQGNWGYKVTGEFQDVNDWENVLSYTIGGVPGRGTVVVREDELPIPIDWQNRALRGQAALAYYLGESEIQLSAGMSESDGVGQTNVGRNQLTDWRYNFVQARFQSPRWYATAYRTQSQSGQSFALNRMADAYARNPNLSADSLRSLSDWPSDGQIYAAELQNNFRVQPLLNTELVWGAQVRRDKVSSKRQWLTDRQTGEDVVIDQYGVYAQTRTPLAQKLELVLAGRVDKHENYATQFSPKVGLLFKPASDHTLRATLNRAFKSPTILQTNFFIPDWTAAVTIFGNTQGYEVKYADGSTKVTYPALEPEENLTYELGYKGLIGDRLFLDVAGYYSDYTNFISPLGIISDPFGLGLAGDPRGTKSFAYSGGELVTHQGGYPALVLIYRNLGNATVYGADIGANYVLTPQVGLKATLSTLKLDNLEVPKGQEEATSLNSPEFKWTLGADFQDVGQFFGDVRLRHVGEYYFRSGINKAVIPGFTTVDFSLGYELPAWGASINLGVSNLFACAGTFKYDTTPGKDPHFQNPVSEERSCGFGEEHIEMVNMPGIGTMAYVGIRYSR